MWMSSVKAAAGVRWAIGRNQNDLETVVLDDIFEFV